MSADEWRGDRLAIIDTHPRSTVAGDSIVPVARGPVGSLLVKTCKEESFVSRAIDYNQRRLRQERPAGEFPDSEPDYRDDGFFILYREA